MVIMLVSVDTCPQCQRVLAAPPRATLHRSICSTRLQEPPSSPEAKTSVHFRGNFGLQCASGPVTSLPTRRKRRVGSGFSLPRSMSGRSSNPRRVFAQPSPAQQRQRLGRRSARPTRRPEPAAPRRSARRPERNALRLGWAARVGRTRGFSMPTRCGWTSQRESTICRAWHGGVGSTSSRQRNAWFSALSGTLSETPFERAMIGRGSDSRLLSCSLQSRKMLMRCSRT